VFARHQGKVMTKKASNSEDFGQLARAMRARLHRYCARMVGSAFDGEDVVQDALAKAAEAWPGAGPIEQPEAWLFRIAHNTALDALRRRKRQAASPQADAGEVADESATADARVAATASLAAILLLPITQRASVVLIDVLGHSLAETATILDVSVAAVKASLHRARAQLKALAELSEPPSPVFSDDERARLRAYADRFNARDFDALRNLLADEVQLELVNRTRLNGRKDVSVYFSRYDAGPPDWRFSAGLAERRPALLVSDPADASCAVRYVVLLDWIDGRIAAIRDFRYAEYVMDSVEAERI
jgi:RNA polymerase sigma-70 factor (ECF subfamily)